MMRWLVDGFGGSGGGANVIFFYSDKDGDTDKSDVGLPPVQGKFVICAEDMSLSSCTVGGALKPGTVDYRPTGNQPGGLATDPADAIRFEYIVVSDCSDVCALPTPEPSTFSLLSTAGGLYGVYGSPSRIATAAE
jgi:hypothetical protein